MTPQAQGIAEYAVLLGTVGGGIVSAVSGIAHFDPLYLLLGGGAIVLLFWFIVYKL